MCESQLGSQSQQYTLTDDFIVFEIWATVLRFYARRAQTNQFVLSNTGLIIGRATINKPSQIPIYEYQAAQ
jgi:hypothetical protein